MYDEWYHFTTDPDWSPEHIYAQWDELITFLSKEETTIGTGPVCIREAPVHPSKFTEVMVTAAVQSLGFPVVSNYNATDAPFGPFYQWQYYQKPNGNRESSSTCIIKKRLIGHPRFHIIFNNHHVLRVLWKGKRAMGVEVSYQNEIKTFYAKHAVILAAGISTPFLLQSSGVGDSVLLDSLQIPVVVHSPRRKALEKSFDRVHHLFQTVFENNFEGSQCTLYVWCLLSGSCNAFQ